VSLGYVMNRTACFVSLKTSAVIIEENNNNNTVNSEA
jgi:hypothetical protein